ncbi:NfeD family protein [Sanguibacter sp. A247]|uniref:NfeD family protein n=1 Tax=unclassified Sanguibacter TaxID=2645534 RepID=UPI003FD8E1EB
MTIFVIIGVVGLLLVIGSMLLGEFIDFGDGIVSGTGLGVGAIVFSAIGIMTTANDLPTWLVYGGSALAGILALWLAQLTITRVQATEDGQPLHLVGMTGVAKSDITPQRGEVFLDAPQEIERRMAWSDAPIDEGTRIVVVAHEGSRVKVAPGNGAVA